MICGTGRQKNDREGVQIYGPLFSYAHIQGSFYSYAEDMTGPMIYVFYLRNPKVYL